MRTLFCGFLALLLLISCTPKPTPDNESNHYMTSTEEGIRDGGIQEVAIKTSDETYKVWTKSFGNNDSIKVLLLAGGPGCTHEYWECMESFFPEKNIEFIYYDQLGCGYSDHPTDTSLWDLPRYVEEMEQVRIALHLDQTNFVLLGHSWGGILAMEYALKYQDHLKALVISNMMSSAPLYDQYAEEVLAPQIPKPQLDSIRAIEANKDFDNPRYMGILNPYFYQKHICRIPLAEWPEPIQRSFSQINSSLYVTMQGPSEFGLSGKLENWDVSQRLQEIATPSLVIGATYDTMDPEHMKWMSQQLKNGTFLLCPNGSHMCMWDDQATYFNGLIKFLLDL